MDAVTDPGAQPAPSASSAGCDNQGDAALKPWEQHGGVIHMPRYLYSSHAAPLLHRSGFLITCTFQREKSATKEAMEILHEFLSVSRVETAEPDAKRARTSTSPVTTGVVEEGQIARSPIEAEGEETTTSEPDSYAAESVKQQEFHLVKLARNGMVYISIPRRAPADLVTCFANTIHSFHTRSRPAPRWCHRIFPVQTTCLWTKQDVRSTVVVLAKEFLERHTATVVSANNPLKYAVALNRRGLEEKEKPVEDSGAAALGKLECIHTVAEAVQSLTPNVSVDLTNPQMVVILEVLPLVRVESCVCAVSVLPRELVVTKPKLVIQGLAPPKQQKQKK